MLKVIVTIFLFSISAIFSNANAFATDQEYFDAIHTLGLVALGDDKKCTDDEEEAEEEKEEQCIKNCQVIRDPGDRDLCEVGCYMANPCND